LVERDRTLTTVSVCIVLSSLLDALDGDIEICFEGEETVDDIISEEVFDLLLTLSSSHPPSPSPPLPLPSLLEFKVVRSKALLILLKLASAVGYFRDLLADRPSFLDSLKWNTFLLLSEEKEEKEEHLVDLKLAFLSFQFFGIATTDQGDGLSSEFYGEANANVNILLSDLAIDKALAECAKVWSKSKEFQPLLSAMAPSPSYLLPSSLLPFPPSPSLPPPSSSTLTSSSALSQISSKKGKRSPQLSGGSGVGSPKARSPSPVLHHTPSSSNANLLNYNILSNSSVPFSSSSSTSSASSKSPSRKSSANPKKQ